MKGLSEDNKNEQKDRLSILMFGPSNGGQSNKQDEDISEDHSNEHNRGERNHFDQWLFGGRAPQQEKSEDASNPTSYIYNIMNNINLDELLYNIDTLVNSAQQLKPLYSKAGPLIKQFFKDKT